MPITYYPNESFKQRTHVVDKLQKPDVLYSFTDSKLLTSASMDFGVWTPKSWEVRRVSMNFSAADVKDYSVAIVHGIGVVAGRNDRLWVKVPGKSAQAIIVPEGFYDGDSMADALETALDASDLPDASKDFTVSFSAGTFEIAPNSGTVAVLVTNPGVNVRMTSTLAPCLGFTVSTSQASSVTSDTAVVGVGVSTSIVSGEDSTVQNIVITDVVAMTVDDELRIGASSANAIVATAQVAYKTLDV